MLLAVDTSNQMMGLALFNGENIIGEMMWESHNHHTVELAPAINDLLARCQVTAAQLEGLGVALGPGSFTSMRIGLALIKGMAFALRIPVVGVSSMDILAYGQPLMEIPMLITLRVGRGRFGIGWFCVEDECWVQQGESMLVTVEELAAQIDQPVYICGELTDHERQIAGRKWKKVLLSSPVQSSRRPAYLAEIAWKRIQEGYRDDVAELSPIYLRVAGNIPA